MIFLYCVKYKKMFEELINQLSSKTAQIVVFLLLSIVIFVLFGVAWASVSAIRNKDLDALKYNIQILQICCWIILAFWFLIAIGGLYYQNYISSSGFKINVNSVGIMVCCCLSIGMVYCSNVCYEEKCEDVIQNQNVTPLNVLSILTALLVLFSLLLYLKYLTKFRHLRMSKKLSGTLIPIEKYPNDPEGKRGKFEPNSWIPAEEYFSLVSPNYQCYDHTTKKWILCSQYVKIHFKASTPQQLMQRQTSPTSAPTTTTSSSTSAPTTTTSSSTSAPTTTITTSSAPTTTTSSSTSAPTTTITTSSAPTTTTSASTTTTSAPTTTTSAAPVITPATTSATTPSSSSPDEVKLGLFDRYISNIVGGLIK
jgi:hypothetical protein